MNNNLEDDSKKTIYTPEEYEKILPKKRKFIIVAMVKEEIKKQGFEGILVFNPIESGYKANRKMYYPKAGTFVFEEYMSQLNTLPLSFLEIEVREIVGKAIRHFKLS